MYFKSQKKTFNIDDRLAIGRDNKPLAAYPSKAGAWWVPILEKAFAKFNVNYI